MTARTFTAKYRDGSGRVREVATGCRDESAARSVLTEMEKRAEKVKGGILSTAEERMIDHQDTPLGDHLEAYLTHLRAKGDSDTHLDDTRRLADKVIADCDFG